MGVKNSWTGNFKGEVDRKNCWKLVEHNKDNKLIGINKYQSVVKTLNELREIAKQHKLKGYSQIRNDQLVDLSPRRVGDVLGKRRRQPLRNSERWRGK